MKHCMEKSGDSSNLIARPIRYFTLMVYRESVMMCFKPFFYLTTVLLPELSPGII